MQIPAQKSLWSVVNIQLFMDFLFKVALLSVYSFSNSAFFLLSFCQLLRKRHIGNDIVTIIFQEPGAQPFTPQNIRSQFQHVFVIVRVHNPCSDNTYYR